MAISLYFGRFHNRYMWCWATEFKFQNGRPRGPVFQGKLLDLVVTRYSTADPGSCAHCVP